MFKVAAKKHVSANSGCFRKATRTVRAKNNLRVSLLVGRGKVLLVKTKLHWYAPYLVRSGQVVANRR